MEIHRKRRVDGNGRIRSNGSEDTEFRAEIGRTGDGVGIIEENEGFTDGTQYAVDAELEYEC